MPAEAAARTGAVAGVLLAAGTSSRMGSNKLLLELDGESVLRRAVRRALGAGLAPVVVVVGHEAERSRRELAGLDCRTLFNPTYLTGIRSSLETGIAALDDDVAAALVMLADMPHVDSAMLATLVARYRASGAALVVSDYDGVTAPPMLYDRSLFPELQNLEGGQGGQQVVKRHRAEAQVVAFPAAALADLDSPADYQAWTLRRGAAG